MSLQDEPLAPSKPFPARRRHGKRGTISLDGPPSPQELSESPHKGADADRFSLYTPEQIERETKDACPRLTFGDVIKIRDQAEMVKECMEIVIKLTRQHDLGSIQQRIEARREVGSLVERLTLFNGKIPYGYRKRRR